MSFGKIVPKVPRKPSRLQLVLTVTEADDLSKSYEGSYAFAIPSNEAEPGERTELERRQGDVLPHLTNTERNQLRAILDKGLALAKGSVD